ncbi:pleiotropic drug resistance ABC transporter [Stereum hirsutum FP-91666 SS1]|uniref:pleiotropic drug resistance ABC transporter n=1 Tax=Stereum hirsutum (strain FP-91666) TaxID=721885 RepID=UPI000440ACC8|nr:pleiotropic drug resistance ABC transporter [Stereum hirsutum FP-91666 SS1]EIM87152.1 pleiotropic drug resistance ABC transporter [Stereum hirsutum FP-91666 SS1]
MAEPPQLDPIREHDGSSSHLPEDLSAANAYANEVLNSVIRYEPRSETPIVVRDRRRESYASHVSIDYFDPAGVDELRRSLSLASNSIHQTEDKERPKSPVPSIANSEATLAPGEGPFDFGKSLRQIIKKRDKSQIQGRELGVLFKDLRVVGLGSAASYQPTLGSLFDPRVFLEKFRAFRNPPLRNLLEGFEGVVRPGEMLLVLGSPGSGCSTLLKTLANQRAEYHSVHGEVHYDSFSPEEIEKHYRGDVIYCPEDDIHFPTLSVDDTLCFAARMRAPHVRLSDHSREQYIRGMVDVLETIFGLRHVKKTPVGDASLRGVSGGEKKRVSIAETMALRSLINSWDNSTRGLDASTALEFVRALRIATDVARVSTIVSIYQAGEQLYDHFDKVCVIYEGRMTYYGAASRAREYFIDLGFEPAPRQTTADFLVAVTDPNGRTVRYGFESTAPRTATEFAERFLLSDVGESNRADMTAFRAEFVGNPQRVEQYKNSAYAEHATTQSKKSPYTISTFMQAKAVANRRFLIIKGALAKQVVSTVIFIIQAIIVGTVFLKSPQTTAAYFSRGGVIFFALLFAALSSMAEIPALFAQRPIVIKHYKAAMYHPFIEAAALTLVDIPITFFTLVFFSIILYFLVGLQRTPAQFFTFFLYILTMSLTMKAWFRAVAAGFGDPAPAQSVAGILLLALTLYTGYAIPKPTMIGALRWITYINPLRWGFEGILSNEFHTLNGQCSTLVPSGPGYENVTIANQVCTTIGSVQGSATVNGNAYLSASYGYSYSNIWRNYAITISFGIAFVICLLFFTEWNTTTSTETTSMRFKRGATTPPQTHDLADEEKGPSSSEKAASGHDDIEEIPLDTPAMKDVFTWQHLDYTVPVGGGQMRRLLDDVSGYVAPGKLTALMGESGAGKTTLLNVLAQRQTSGVVTGERLVNGQALPADFQAQTGYCQQMDTHLPTTTVREALLFSAKLRQPASVSDQEKEAYVETVLKMCGLEKFADAIVGSLGVEHKKRTTIGVELAAKPKLLLFLDEPTSGLDSQSAWAIMRFLRSLADRGQAILCTIHQPSSELFQVFDRLLLLKKGGQTVYFGDLGPNAMTLLNYFEKNGGYPCSPQANPAEYILDVIGAGATATTDIDWHSAWKNSDQARIIDKELENILAEGRARPPVTTELHTEFTTSWPYQVSTLLRRDLQRHWRDPQYLVSKIALNIVAGLFIGFTFWKANNSIQGTQNRLFACFMGMILCAALANQIQVPFIATRNIYEVRERPSRMYSWTALLASQLLSELPWNILGSSLYFLCWFWTVGFASDRGGFTYLMIGIVFPLFYQTFGMWVASMAPSAEVAALLFSFLFSFTINFNGIVQPYAHLGWWKWMYRTSPLTYFVSAVVGQAVGQYSVVCKDKELVHLTPPSGQTCGDYLSSYINASGGYITDPSATDTCSYCSSATTDEFLANNFNIFYSQRWRNFGLMWAYIFFNIAAIYGLTWFFRIRTGSILGSLRRLGAGKTKSA